MIGLAASPGTDVDPVWCTSTASPGSAVRMRCCSAANACGHAGSGATSSTTWPASRGARYCGPPVSSTSVMLGDPDGASGALRAGDARPQTPDSPPEGAP